MYEISTKGSNRQGSDMASAIYKRLHRMLSVVVEGKMSHAEGVPRHGSKRKKQKDTAHTLSLCVCSRCSEAVPESEPKFGVVFVGGKESAFFAAKPVIATHDVYLVAQSIVRRESAEPPLPYHVEIDEVR